MRILSIDLPWSATKGQFGFAWLDTACRSPTVTTCFLPNAPQTFAAFACQHGKFDVILIDQPIGAGSGTGYRAVERAFCNSSFVQNGPHRIQAPRFQPGAPHAAAGLQKAHAAGNDLGTATCVIVESFPQLSIPSLLTFATTNALAIGAVTRLAQHKGTGLAAQQLVGAFSAWTNTNVTGPASTGQPDAVDAMLALLPLLEVLNPSNHATAAPIWLHAVGPHGAPHPSTINRRSKAAARAAWTSALNQRQVGQAGVRSDGLLGLILPGWLPPTGPPRAL